ERRVGAVAVINDQRVHAALAVNVGVPVRRVTEVKRIVSGSAVKQQRDSDLPFVHVVCGGKRVAAFDDERLDPAGVEGISADGRSNVRVVDDVGMGGCGRDV